MLRHTWMLALLPALGLGATPDEIRAILVNRIEEGQKAVGIVIGTIDKNGRQVFARGRVGLGREREPDGDTVFEIGSISKVFTSLLLADMIERGEVKADDPVSKYLPASVTVPSRNGRNITLLDLSMQISGLPRLPSNLKPADPGNPYADYTVAQLYDFLSHYTLTREPGEKYEYSNLGAGLLGHVLALKAGMSYEQLLRKRILEPLGMDSTSITLSDSQQKRLAPGYDSALNPVENWDLPTLAGAGAIRSTVNDMLKFLAANLGLKDTPLHAAMLRMRSVQHATGTPDLDIDMAWHVWKKYGTEIVWHNGGTAGYRSFAGFDPAQGTGVVILCNTFFDNDDAGLHLLESKYPVEHFSKPKPAVQVDEKILESYVGKYEFGPTFAITITREGGRLFAQATGQPRFEIFASSDSEFFLKVVDAQISFVRADGAKVAALILHQNGMSQKAIKAVEK